ncbi:MAG: hypothetical protein DLM59_08210 [Pseudonocardiales bacterium]|nr:MAG: hypothetical protein DLM59_08210 [Pseudonocardiales bacterium]
MTESEWYPADGGNITRQQSVVHTQLERWEPATVPVYAAPARHRGSTTAALVEHASPRVRVAVANLLLALLAVIVTVFTVALVILGVRMWGWLA